MIRSAWLATFALLGTTALWAIAEGKTLKYPDTRKTDQVDDYHGTKVADPYRWLEDDVRKSKDVEAWVEAQNKITFAFLEAIPERLGIRARMTELWNYPRYSVPEKEGNKFFFSKNDGLQNQAVMYELDALDGTPKLLLDPNTWSKDGTVALQTHSFSHDATYLAYGVADAGSDWSVLKVMEVAGRKVLDDELRWVKFAGA